MAKALKVAAVVVGATALAFTGVGLAVGLGTAAMGFGFGVSASTLFLASAGLAVASQALTKAPTIPGSQTDRLAASVDPRAFRKTVLGMTAMPARMHWL